MGDEFLVRRILTVMIEEEPLLGIENKYATSCCCWKCQNRREKKKGFMVAWTELDVSMVDGS